MNNNQSGHEQNVVNLGVLIARITTFENYNPSRLQLTVENLSLQKVNCESALNNVSAAENMHKKAIAVRTDAFVGFDSFVTRIANAVRICGASEQTIAQVESIIRELHGKRASDKFTDEELAAAKEKGEEKSQNTVHNANFDRRIENFGKLLSFLGTIPEYAPNETDLSIEALSTKSAVFKEANNTYITSAATLDAARLARNIVLYEPIKGLYDTQSAVKKYVKSAFGANSPQYKAISDIAFTNKI